LNSAKHKFSASDCSLTLERQTCGARRPRFENGLTPKGIPLSDLTAQKRSLTKPEPVGPKAPRPRAPEGTPRREPAPRQELSFAPKLDLLDVDNTTGVRLRHNPPPVPTAKRPGVAAPAQSAMPEMSATDDQTRQYKVPADVLERFLTSKARKSERAQSLQQATTTAPPPNTSHEEGPPTSAPLPRFSSPRVPSDLLPIIASEDHELSDDVTVNLTPLEVPEEARREPTLLKREFVVSYEAGPRNARSALTQPAFDAAHGMPEENTLDPVGPAAPAGRRIENIQLILASVLLIALGILTGLSLGSF
jgi:hypothetical protein